jgi:hypothetical protein
MAAQANEQERFEIECRAVEDMIDELPRLADDFATMSVDEVISWSLEWGNSMSKLRGLVEMDAAGRLNPEQQRRVRTLAEDAVQVLPRVEELDWRRPASSVLAAGRVRVSP